VFLIKLTRNRGMGSKWVFPLDARRVAVICFTVTMLKFKSLRLLEVFSAGVSGGGDGLLP
jgi:hypothetical protein